MKRRSKKGKKEKKEVGVVVEGTSKKKKKKNSNFVRREDGVEREDSVAGREPSSLRHTHTHTNRSHALNAPGIRQQQARKANGRRR